MPIKQRTAQMIIIYSHTTEYYSAIEKNEPLAQATTWKVLKIIMMSERKQSKKYIYFWLYVTFQKCNLIDRGRKKNQ